MLGTGTLTSAKGWSSFDSYFGCSETTAVKMKEAEYLRRQADECRKAAETAAGKERRGLRQLANHYEKEALRLEPVTHKRLHDEPKVLT